MSTQVTHKLNWNGPALRAQVVEAVVLGVTRFGLHHETLAKGKLVKGRGKVTATLQRSIHAADPSYNFAGDDVPPSTSSPERGGKEANISEVDGKVAVAVGSGLVYARRIENLYGYMEESHAEALPQLPVLIEQAAQEKGLA